MVGRRQIKDTSGVAARRAALALLLGLPWAATVAGTDPAALTHQGLRYLHGEGVARDTNRAVIYLCAAAERRQASAAFELGWLYFQGRGVARDDALALSWFRRATELGEPIPTNLMARLAGIKPSTRRCTGERGQDLALTDARRLEFTSAIYDIAPQYGLDPALVLEVVRAESNFDPLARSHKGALGLMQLIPATARRFGVEDPLEPLQNLHGGMAYLRWLVDRFNGDLKMVLAGYNAGEGAVERFGGVPPYAETRAYVRRILSRYADDKA